MCPDVSGLQAAQVLFCGPGQVSGGLNESPDTAIKFHGGRVDGPTQKAEVRSLCFLFGRGGDHAGGRRGVTLVPLCGGRPREYHRARLVPQNGRATRRSTAPRARVPGAFSSSSEQVLPRGADV